MKHRISQFIDFFYPPFRSVMPIETFRYAACGGANTLMGLFTFFIGYRYIFAKKIFDIGFFAFEPYSAALILSSTITFFVGFALNRYVVFTSSYLRGRIQLLRYFLSFTINLVVNYGLLKLLVEILHLDAMFSQFITIVFVVSLSYFTQRYYTFRIKNNDAS